MSRRDGRPVHEEQVANAKDSFVDLSPVDPGQREVHAVAPYQALLPGQEIPLIGERVDGYDEEE
jgi:hypothetical protein